MTNSRVTGVRSIELGVRDLHQSAEFYTKVWALEEVSADGDSIHFRATGGEHHVLTIRERPQASLLGVHFAAADRDAVDQLCAKAKGYGVALAGDPAPLDASAGGGYGFRFETPDGLPMTISSDSVQHPNVVLDRSRPTNPYGRPRGKTIETGTSWSTQVPPIVSRPHPGVTQTESICVNPIVALRGRSRLRDHGLTGLGVIESGIGRSGSLAVIGGLLPAGGSRNEHARGALGASHPSTHRTLCDPATG